MEQLLKEQLLKEHLLRQWPKIIKMEVCLRKPAVGWSFLAMAAIFPFAVRVFPDSEFLQRQRLLEKVFTTEARALRRNRTPELLSERRRAAR